MHRSWFFSKNRLYLEWKYLLISTVPGLFWMQSHYQKNSLFVPRFSFSAEICTSIAWRVQFPSFQARNWGEQLFLLPFPMTAFIRICHSIFSFKPKQIHYKVIYLHFDLSKRKTYLKSILRIVQRSLQSHFRTLFASVTSLTSISSKLLTQPRVAMLDTVFCFVAMSLTSLSEICTRLLHNHSRSARKQQSQLIRITRLALLFKTCNKVSRAVMKCNVRAESHESQANMWKWSNDYYMSVWRSLREGSIKFMTCFGKVESDTNRLQAPD